MNRKSKTTSLVNRWKANSKSRKKGKKGDSYGFDVVDRLNGVHLIKRKAQLKKKRRKSKKRK